MNSTWSSLTNRGDVNETVQNLRDTSASFKQLAADLQAGNGLAGGLLKDRRNESPMTVLLSNANAIAAAFSTFGSNLNQRGIWHMLWKPKPAERNRRPGALRRAGRQPLPMRSLWVIRILFLTLCVLAGYEVSQVEPDWITSGFRGCVIGFGLGGLCVAMDEMLKGFSLRAFSAVTFGLFLGTIVASLIDRSGLFADADDPQRRVIRLVLVPEFRLPRHGPGHAQQQGGFLPHHPLRPLRLPVQARKPPPPRHQRYY